MTQEEMIEMAVAAGIIPWTKHEHIGGNKFSASDEGLDGDLASLIQFAKLVAAKEREACADICGRFAMNAAMNELDSYDAYRDCEEAIRARGQQ